MSKFHHSFGIALLASAIFFGINQNAYAGTKRPYCPIEAKHSRVDISKDKDNTKRIPNGSWLEHERHKGDWGNSICLDPGNSCVNGDTFTWWYKVEPPVDPKQTKGTDMQGKVPDGWNSNTNDYNWVNN